MWDIYICGRWPSIWATIPSCLLSSIHPSVRPSIHPSIHPLYLPQKIDFLSASLVGFHGVQLIVVCEWSTFGSALLVLSPTLHLFQLCTSQQSQLIDSGMCFVLLLLLLEPSSSLLHLSKFPLPWAKSLIIQTHLLSLPWILVLHVSPEQVNLQRQKVH